MRTFAFVCDVFFWKKKQIFFASSYWSQFESCCIRFDVRNQKDAVRRAQSLGWRDKRFGNVSSFSPAVSWSLSMNKNVLNASLLSCTADGKNRDFRCDCIPFELYFYFTETTSTSIRKRMRAHKKRIVLQQFMNDQMDEWMNWTAAQNESKATDRLTGFS